MIVDIDATQYYSCVGNCKQQHEQQHEQQYEQHFYYFGDKYDASYYITAYPLLSGVGTFFMIPSLEESGNLPHGIHWADWEEFETRFGTNSHRRKLMKGLKAAIASLRKAGCSAIYVDGSFVTAKELPNDFDGCWSIEGVDAELLNPVFLDFSNGREAQKAKYQGELFPAEWIEGGSGKTWLEFFQQDRNGKPKGIVGIRLKKPREKI